MAGDRHGFAGHCYDQKPGESLYCLITEPPHDGDHFNWVARESWPQTEASPSKAISPAGESTAG